MKRLSVVALFGLALNSSWAETAKYLVLKPTKAVTTAVSKSADIVVEAEVEKGFHIQANPASKPNLIATTLTLTGVEPIALSAPVYPVGKPWKLLGSPEEILTYDGTVQIKVPFKATKPGKYTVEGKLRYQACSEKTCFFPMTVPVKAQITVSK